MITERVQEFANRLSDYNKHLWETQNYGIWDEIQPQKGGIRLQTGRFIMQLNDSLEIEYINTFGNISAEEWNEYNAAKETTEEMINDFINEKE